MAFERRSYNLDSSPHHYPHHTSSPHRHNRLSFHGGNTGDPVMCEYWSKPPISGRQQNWGSTAKPANRNHRNCVKENLPNNKVKVKVANETYTVTLRDKQNNNNNNHEEKKSPIRDIFKRFSFHYRKKKVEKDLFRRRPRKYFTHVFLCLFFCIIFGSW